MIHVFIQIKFRAFLWTIGYVRKVFHLGLPIPLPLPGFSQILFDDRGVFVQVSDKDLWTGVVKLDQVESAEVGS